MSEAIRKFAFEAYNVRVVVIDEEPWFFAKDVSSILGYTDTQAMTRRLDRDEQTTCTDDSSGQVRRVLIINESGLYNAILGSNKKEARKFKKWVTGVVLPAIRKHGAYMTESVIDGVLSNPDSVYKLAKTLLDERDGRIQAEAERDKAIRERAWISNCREATAMQTASALTRRNHRLEKEKEALLDRIDEIDEELGVKKYYADRYLNWKSKVGRPRKGFVKPDRDHRVNLF